MVKAEIAYICDCCGRKFTKDIDPMLSGKDVYVSDNSIPDGWQKMIEPFGLCCDHCMNAFMNVYDSLRR